jgi:hypothetical protein
MLREKASPNNNSLLKAPSKNARDTVRVESAHHDAATIQNRHAYILVETCAPSTPRRDEKNRPHKQHPQMICAHIGDVLATGSWVVMLMVFCGCKFVSGRLGGKNGAASRSRRVIVAQHATARARRAN